jgi:hypothetical protein
MVLYFREKLCVSGKIKVRNNSSCFPIDRTAAESQLNDHWVAQQPDLLLLGLAQFVATNQEVQVSLFHEKKLE